VCDGIVRWGVDPSNPPMNAPRVSLVVPLFNASFYTRLFLLALRDVLPAEPDCEVVLVDNGSTDDTGRVLGELAGGYRVVALPENRHFAGGCNAGAAASRGELLFFLNNDTVPTRGFLSAALDTLEADERIAAVGCRLLFPDGRIQHGGIAFDASGAPHNLHAFLPGDHPAANRVVDLQAVTGAALLVRRWDFEDVGGFHTGYRNAFEDVDLCLTLRARGRRIVFCPTSVLYHFLSSTEGRYDWEDENFRLYHERWGATVDPDLERLRVGGDGRAGGDWEDAAPKAIAAEVLHRLVDHRREVTAWRRRAEAAEARLGGLIGATDGPPRVLHVDCPTTFLLGETRAVAVQLAPGRVPELDLIGRWSGSGAPAPARVKLTSPLGGVADVRLPLSAPASAGSCELEIALCVDGGDPFPSWRRTVDVRPLYGAAYRAKVPECLVAGRAVVIPVRVSNEGALPWEGGEFRLSYHWRADDGSERYVRDGLRTAIPRPLGPDEAVALRARVEAPTVPGRYLLEWDVVIECVTWLSEVGAPPAAFRVDVIAPEEDSPREPRRPDRP